MAAGFMMYGLDARFIRKHVRTLKLSRLLTATSLLAIGWLGGGGAFAQSVLPTGGRVVSGQATITTSGDTTTITQPYYPNTVVDSSNKAIITWDSFSIGKDQTVQFNNGDGATLNRVLTGNLSTIDGTLSATGTVYLINPSGVVIGKSGIVNVGGTFVASTLDTPSVNFLGGGDKTFTGVTSTSVVNLGQIGALGRQCRAAGQQGRKSGFDQRRQWHGGDVGRAIHYHARYGFE